MPVHWYIGVTGSGKTTRALQDLGDDIKGNKRPALVIDSQGVKLLAGISHCRSWQETARQVWIKKRNAAFIPKSPEEVSALFAVARELGNTNILLDEAAFWMSSRSIARPIELAFRTHLHTGLTIRATTQAMDTIAPVAMQCSTSIKIFRCNSLRILERLKQEFAVKPEEVERLERGQFLDKGSGF